jgi:hypothetical protein
MPKPFRSPAQPILNLFETVPDMSTAFFSGAFLKILFLVVTEVVDDGSDCLDGTQVDFRHLLSPLV